MKQTLLGTFTSLCAALLFTTNALAEDTILTVNHTAEGRSVSFTYEELLALPQTEFRTSTIWTSGVDTYTGPSLAAVLDAAEMPQDDLRIFAINDYNVDFPADRIVGDTPILTIQVNGAPFSIREKGPIWLLFPFDDDHRFRTEDNFALSVWQLNQIDVAPE
ncbi:MAG: oxidoreductase [Loktanella sp.]|nr:oxidoreductase [Loktanella sp.]